MIKKLTKALKTGTMCIELRCNISYCCVTQIIDMTTKNCVTNRKKKYNIASVKIESATLMPHSDKSYVIMDKFSWVVSRPLIRFFHGTFSWYYIELSAIGV